ncbi:MAG TPA: GNAT family N-acetyltransferase, partial [Caldilineaceae bacterium]|nr:GNAT family N-acetyltransferase [Caldilineaceae bacterium]
METTEFVFRPATSEDCRLLWEWANDPAVRAASFISKVIPWEEHVQWFQTKLKSPNAILWIVENSAQAPIGLVRFETNETEATISISLDQRFRNKGYGSNVIRLAIQKLFDTSQVQVVHAYIRPENEPSVHAFRKANFDVMGFQ